MTRFAFLLPALALAACNPDATQTVETNQATAAPVAAASPAAGSNWTETVSQTAEGGFVMGNPNAPIKLVEYGARSCPTCGQLARDGFAPLTEKYVATGKVSFEFRDFLVHGAPDLALALVGQCGGTGPFFPLLEQQYAMQNQYLDALQKISPQQQQAMTTMTPAQVATALAEAMGQVDFAKQRGLPEAKVRACLTDQKAIETLAKQTETAGGEVTGTPTLLINGKKLDGVVTWEGLEAALKQAGA